MPATTATTLAQKRKHGTGRAKRGELMPAKKKAFWDKKNPVKKPSKLTDSQKRAAKARAKKAGRPYPNLVDNAAMARKKKK